MKLRYYIIGLLCMAIALPALADNAVTTYQVFNIPETRLNQGITAAATSFDIAAPIRNGTTQFWPAQTGGILELKNSRYQEYIHYTGTTINYTTKVTTLTGVTRGYCWNLNSFASCESGRVWSKGTQVTQVDDMRLFNFSAYQDRANSYSASGATTYVGSGSLAFPTFATTAERDRQLGSSGSEYRAACVTATGVCYLRLAGTWTQIGDAGTANATTTTAGKIELAGTGDTIAMVGAGDSGATTVVTASITSMTGGLTSDIGKVPLLNANGVLAPSLGGLGLASLTQSGLVMGNGTSPVSLINGATQNHVLKLSATSTPVFGKVPSPSLYIASSNLGKLGDSSTQVETGTLLTVTGATIDSSNDTIKVRIVGGYRNTGGNNTVQLWWGTGSLASHTWTALTSGGEVGFDWTVYIQADSASTNATLKSQSIFNTADSNMKLTTFSTDTETNFDTTKAQQLKVTSVFSTNSASNYLNPFVYHVELIDQ